MRYTIGQIAALLGLEYQGDGSRLLNKVSKWDVADETSLIFLQREECGILRTEITRAGCIIAPKAQAPSGINALFSDQPKLDFAKAASYLHSLPKSKGTRHSTAEIAADAILGDNVELGPWVVVEPGTQIGKGSILRSGVVIGAGSRIGEDCILFPGVVLYPGVCLGDRVILHAGAVIGGDGFG